MNRTAKTLKFTNFYTRESCLKGIEIKDFAVLAKDRDTQRGNKSFLRVPLADFQSIDLSANHHLYEILPPDTPVKPYFDLEMEYDGLEQETIYDLFNGFADWLMKEMKTLFSIDLRPDDFVVLDSCRTNKLSFHLIIQTHICFKNVAEHKVFIAYIWNRFLNPADETEAELFQKLTYKVKDETRFIFDRCVYGNFQNIRLVGQSKMGKTYVLKNINQRWKLNETTIRLYDGVGDRFVAHVEPLVQNFVISTQKTTKTRKSKNTPTERIH